MDPAHRDRSSIFAVNLGLAANVVLAALKTAVGILGHSPALLADGINSTSDVVYYVVVRVFVGLARTPADDEHPYGHRQLESIAALIVGAFVVTTGVTIFWGSVNAVYDMWRATDVAAGASLLALLVAVFTVLTKIILTAVTKRVGRRTHNLAVIALAYDHRNDIMAASAATLGILGGRMGHPWIDPLAGALVALIVLGTGIKILRESSDDLMDTVPGKALRQQIATLIRAMPGVELEEVQAHRFGPYLVANLTIGVNGSMSVEEGDRIATRVERTLCREIDFLMRVHVHYHPAIEGSRQRHHGRTRSPDPAARENGRAK
ncbi:cation transporter [Candidatus Fermentibacteria bacterium]|nr:cation transporter [Candidatus Fermentibacteria bacterium]